MLILYLNLLDNVMWMCMMAYWGWMWMMGILCVSGWLLGYTVALRTLSNLR
jgi:hypothetical protein